MNHLSALIAAFRQLGCTSVNITDVSTELGTHIMLNLSCATDDELTALATVIGSSIPVYWTSNDGSRRWLHSDMMVDGLHVYLAGPMRTVAGREAA